MKLPIFFILLICGLFLINFNVYSIVSVIITFYFVIQIIFKSSSTFAFREWTLLLYAVNYLFSPTITYLMDQDTILYPMKIPASEYFEIALPGFFCFYLGIFSIKTRIFKPSLVKIKTDVMRNELLLRNMVIFGVLADRLRFVVPGEISFLLYLISSLRFVGAFSLFGLNTKKYWIWVFFLLINELYRGAISGLYHDAVMWILFFALYFSYIIKPSVVYKLIGVAGIITFVLLVQAVKVSYRSKVLDENAAGLDLVVETTSDVSSELNSESNLLASLNRGNQAWIFASTMDRMNRVNDYQGLRLLGIYLEAALMPRFLAPDKINSGDKKIFNSFSGHNINENTSMGLGVFADGYIAFGYWGVVFFTFGLGLIFGLTFIVVESWAKLSEFYILLLLPLLNYAVRPDCELQTTINHLVKGLIVFGILVKLTKFKFVINASKVKSLGLKSAVKPNLDGIQT